MDRSLRPVWGLPKSLGRLATLVEVAAIERQVGGEPPGVCEPGCVSERVEELDGRGELRLCLFALAAEKRQRSEVALAWDSGGQGGDLFASTVLHMLRGQWLDGLGRPTEADAARLWYEHTDMRMELTGEGTAAEIDWAFGPYAMWLRGTTAASHGNNPEGCPHLQRVLEIWRDADSAYAPLRDSAQVLVTNLRCSP